MTDIPIIFSAPMVLALLGGRKTQTRRLAWTLRRPKGENPPPNKMWVQGPMGTTPPTVRLADGVGAYYTPSSWQKVNPGDRLWVRENCAKISMGGAMIDTVHYPATPDQGLFLHKDRKWRASAVKPQTGLKLTPSIHMPRWASRLTLVVTGVKVEPVQNISDDDVLAEGMIPWGGGDIGSDGKWHRLFHSAVPGNEHSGDCAPDVYKELWTYLHGAESWASNPEVVAISFEVHQTNIDALKVAA